MDAMSQRASASAFTSSSLSSASSSSSASPSSSPSSSEFSSSTDRSHDDNGHQRPFMATSAGLGKVAQKQSVRMQDAQIRNKMDKRWREESKQVRKEHTVAARASSYLGADHPEHNTGAIADEVRVPAEASLEFDGLLHQWMRLAGYASESSGQESLDSNPRREQTGKAQQRYVGSPLMEEHEGTLKSRYGIAEGELGEAKKDGAPLSLAQRIRDDAGREPSRRYTIANKLRSPHDTVRYEGAAAQGAPPQMSLEDGGAPTTYPSPPQPRNDTLQLLLPLVILLSTLLFLLILFVVLVIFVKRRTRIALSEAGGPLDVGREEELEGHGGFDGVEERWLETVDEPVRRGYSRAKDWSTSFPPGSQSTEITLSQFLSIQEKGVSAWSFDPDYENNPSVFVEGRTEITFLADGQGMTPQEGGGCSVQSNLPLPKLNEVYYWEAKLFSKPDMTNIAIGLATKPYPSFRMPGWAKFSVGYFSEDGFKCHNYPFSAQSYGPSFVQGDVIGVGYRPRNGTVFFTRNGKKLEDAFVGLNRYNLFPTIGADGAAEVSINLGQAGFVFIEANVKKWGLAPMVGTLGPPPPYGMERGSILIEAGQGTSSDQQHQQQHQQPSLPPQLPSRDSTPPPPPTPPNETDTTPAAPSSSARMHRSQARRHNQALQSLSEQQSTANEFLTAEHSRHSPYASPERAGVDIRRSGSVSSVEEPHNPPTPHHLDISMHSLHESLADTQRYRHTGSPSSSTARGQRISSRRSAGIGGGMNLSSYFPQLIPGGSSSSSGDPRGPSPPPYLDARHTWAGSEHPSTDLSWNDAQHATQNSSNRIPSFASSLFGALSERGLLTPLSTRDHSSEGSADTSRRDRMSRHAPGPIALPTGDVEERRFFEEQQQQEEGRHQEALPSSNSRQRGWLASWWS